MVDTTLAKWIDAAAQRSTEVAPIPTNGAPYLFDVDDPTWAGVYLFGPVGRVFGAFIDRGRHFTKNSILVVPGGQGPHSSVDVCESLRRAAIDLERLQRGAVAPNHSREASLQYLDFLLWLEAFLLFLLWNGFPAFLSANLVSDLYAHHKATFKPAPGTPGHEVDASRDKDLWSRRQAHQPAGPGAHVPPGITIVILPTDWIDPRASAMGASARGVIDGQRGLMFPSCFPPPPSPTTASSARKKSETSGKRAPASRKGSDSVPAPSTVPVSASPPVPAPSSLQNTTASPSTATGKRKASPNPSTLMDADAKRRRTTTPEMEPVVVGARGYPHVPAALPMARLSPPLPTSLTTPTSASTTANPNLNPNLNLPPPPSFSSNASLNLNPDLNVTAHPVTVSLPKLNDKFHYPTLYDDSAARPTRNTFGIPRLNILDRIPPPKRKAVNGAGLEVKTDADVDTDGPGKRGLASEKAPVHSAVSSRALVPLLVSDQRPTAGKDADVQPDADTVLPSMSTAPVDASVVALGSTLTSTSDAGAAADAPNAVVPSTSGVPNILDARIVTPGSENGDKGSPNARTDWETVVPAISSETSGIDLDADGTSESTAAMMQVDQIPPASHSPTDEHRETDGSEMEVEAEVNGVGKLVHSPSPVSPSLSSDTGIGTLMSIEATVEPAHGPRSLSPPPASASSTGDTFSGLRAALTESLPPPPALPNGVAASASHGIKSAINIDDSRTPRGEVDISMPPPPPPPVETMVEILIPEFHPPSAWTSISASSSISSISSTDSAGTLSAKNKGKDKEKSTASTAASAKSRMKSKSKAKTAGKVKAKSPLGPDYEPPSRRKHLSSSSSTSTRRIEDLPLASTVHTAVGAPRILGSHLLMSFALGPKRAFGKKDEMEGDVEALGMWFRAGEREGVEDFLWYVEEVLRRAADGLGLGLGLGEFNSASNSNSDGEQEEGESELGLVLERVSDPPRAFGEGTVGEDGQAVRLFLAGLDGGSEMGGRFAGYIRKVLEQVREGL